MTGMHTPPADAPLFDELALQGLRAAFGDKIAMLLGRTRAVIEDRAGQIAPLAAEGPSHALGRLAHEIGGMAGQVGLARLGAAALALEALCEAGGDADAVRAAAARLALLAETSLEALPSA